jgi:hypothetical protein
MKTVYHAPISILIQSDLPAVIAQSGGFNFIFSNVTDNCCTVNPAFCENDGNGGPPENVPVPGLIEVSNGVFTIQFFDPGTNKLSHCTLSGPIGSDGSISFDIDSTCFTDDGCTLEENPDCCVSITTNHIEGSFDGEHLTLHLTVTRNYDQNQPECTIGPSTAMDCSDSGDIDGERI